MALAEKIAGAPHGVAAELVSEATAPDQDGRSWIFMVSDAKSPARRLQATVTGSEAARLRAETLEDRDALERAVETAAPRFKEELADGKPLPDELILKLSDFF